MQAKEKIQRLRSEASEKHWGKCREIAGELMKELKNADMIKLVQTHMKRFLLICQRTYSSDSIFDSVIEIIRDTNSLQELKDQITEILNQLDGKCDPDYIGMNSFRSSLNEFKRLSSLSVEGILDVVSGIHMAILTHTWGIDNLELWTQWYRQESPEAKSILAKYFWPNVETQELYKKCWNYTADIVQDLLM